MIGFVEKMNMPCQIFWWKVLDFVEANILVWRAEIDLVKIFFGTCPRGPLLDRGVQHLPPNCKRDVFDMVWVLVWIWFWNVLDVILIWF